MVLGAAVLAALPAAAARIRGVVRSPDGVPIAGALVTLRRGTPIHDVSVWSDDAGRFRSPELAAGGPYLVRVKRIGWREGWQPPVGALRAGEQRALDLQLEREDDPSALAAQWPANHWFALLLDRFDDPQQREEFVRQCTYCHQQGSAATRRLRSDDEWQKVLALMARMGGVLSPKLRAQVPRLVREAYAPASAVAALTAGRDAPDYAPPPPSDVRRAVVDEWELGLRNSMQHDLIVHPDGRVYTADMMQDRLFRLDPRVPGGARASFRLPRGDLPLGGVFGGHTTPTPPNADAHVGPHSLQVAPDGAIWTTLALGNQLARFDVEAETWEVFPLAHGYYPHTLRFDARGRIWYTVAASNHIGRLDPASGEHRQVRLPARGLAQAIALRLLPVYLWANRHFDVDGAFGNVGEGMTAPVPYGIDVAPDGSVWFSQLNAHRIGRIDPDSLEVEMVDTPFTAPRRLRFDSRGGLWIPGFSSGVVARFDPGTRRFETIALPVAPRGSETPYALNVDRRRDIVWVCGTNSDSLIRLDPAARAAGAPDGGFRIYPLPTRVTYTRDVDFDAQGRVWTSNSNLPAWQIEGGFPRVLRLDPDPAPDGSATAAVPPQRHERMATR